jgi:hypothetical protein
LNRLCFRRGFFSCVPQPECFNVWIHPPKKKSIGPGETAVFADLVRLWTGYGSDLSTQTRPGLDTTDINILECIYFYYLKKYFAEDWQKWTFKIYKVRNFRIRKKRFGSATLQESGGRKVGHFRKWDIPYWVIIRLGSNYTLILVGGQKSQETIRNRLSLKHWSQASI